MMLQKCTDYEKAKGTIVITWQGDMTAFKKTISALLFVSSLRNHFLNCPVEIGSKDVKKVTPAEIWIMFHAGM